MAYNSYFYVLSSCSMTCYIISSYHIPDMIPVALPPRVAGDGLEELSSYFV